jgi:hypothetical protein
VHHKREQVEQSRSSEGRMRWYSLVFTKLFDKPVARFVPYVLFALLSVNLCGSTIEYQVNSDPKLDQYVYTYFLTGISVGLYEGIDVQFDASLYGTLSGATTESGFTDELLQPNNPPGAYGDYITWATVNNPPLTGPFTVDFTYLGPGLPGPQVFNIDQFDSNGNLVNTIGSGETTPFTAPVPEPATVSLYLSGLICLVVFGTLVRRRSARGHSGDRGAAT